MTVSEKDAFWREGKPDADGLEIIGVHTTLGSDEVEQFVTDNSIPWPIAVDVDKKTVSAWHVHNYPDYYLIDRSGNLRVADLYEGHLEMATTAMLSKDAQDGKRTKGPNEKRLQLLVP